MSTFPADLAARVGHEVSLGDIFRAAWRQHKRFFWPVVGYGLLASLIAAGAAMVVSGIGSVISMIIILPTAMSSRGGPPVLGGAQLAGNIVQVILNILPAALVGVPVFGGFLWSVVCTYDGRRMAVNDLFHGFRTRYKTLVGVGFVYAAGVAVGQLILQVMVFVPLMTAAGGSPTKLWTAIPAMLATILVGYALMVLCQVITNLLTYLAPMLPFTQDKVSLWKILHQNWMALRSRPLTFLIAALFTSAVMVVVSSLIVGTIVALVAGAIASGNTPFIVIAILVGLVLALALFVASVWAIVFDQFLRTAFLRSVCGYSLTEAEPQNDTPAASVGPAAIVATPAAGALPGLTAPPYGPAEPQEPTSDGPPMREGP